MIKNKTIYLLFALSVLSLVSSKAVLKDFDTDSIFVNHAVKNETTSNNETHDHSDGWTPLSLTGGSLVEGNYYIDENYVDTTGIYQLSSALSVGTSTNVSICLNGFTLLAAANTSAVTVGVSGNFSLHDCSVEATGTLSFYATDTSNTIYGISSAERYASITIYGGTISQLYNVNDYVIPTRSYGVYLELNNTSFVMYGGKISKISASSHAYAIYQDSIGSTIEINGGTIENIYGNSARGIYQNSSPGSIIFNNGTIQNIVASTSASAIFQGKEGTLEINNSTFSDISGFLVTTISQSSSTGSSTVSINSSTISNLSGTNASNTYLLFQSHSYSSINITNSYLTGKIKSNYISVQNGYFDLVAYESLEGSITEEYIILNIEEKGGTAFDEDYLETHPYALYLYGGTPTYTITVSVDNDVYDGTDYEDDIIIEGNVCNLSYSYSYQTKNDSTVYENLPTTAGEYIVTITFPDFVALNENNVKEYYESASIDFELTVLKSSNYTWIPYLILAGILIVFIIFIILVVKISKKKKKQSS